jgi:hypothetical protein
LRVLFCWFAYHCQKFIAPPSTHHKHRPSHSTRPPLKQHSAVFSSPTKQRHAQAKHTKTAAMSMYVLAVLPLPSPHSLTSLSPSPPSLPHPTPGTCASSASNKPSSCMWNRPRPCKASRHNSAKLWGKARRTFGCLDQTRYVCGSFLVRGGEGREGGGRQSK